MLEDLNGEKPKLCRWKKIVSDMVYPIGNLERCGYTCKGYDTKCPYYCTGVAPGPKPELK